jgi:OPA family glycerol-3-phosphate transporter-like MFS transporter/OPA family sugar phosphate sensor protein UhpC-like MFS transporter
VEPITDPGRVQALYTYWRTRMLYSLMIGYAVFYLIRKNLSVAMPGIQSDLGITKTDLGLFLTLHGILYGVSKFANGYLGDRTNARVFMVAGLLLSAVMNIGFGLGSTALALGLFWLANGWFQGMGFPPCARSLTHWFAPSERGTKFSIWNTSHSIGAALAVLLCSELAQFGWRYCLLVPAAIAILGAVFLYERLRDTPQSLGLPKVEVWKGEAAPASAPPAPGGDSGREFRAFLVQRVFLNPFIWFVSLANFFVYTVRYTVLDWGPTFLMETRGVNLRQAGWTVAAYEVAGILGMLASGWLTDRVFRGRGGRACFFYMLCCAVCVTLFWKLQVRSIWGNTLLLCGAGFFIYGPQCLVGVVAANLATRRAAATAIGLTGFFGYLSGLLSGWGIGYMAQHHGWQPVFATLMGASVVATLFFALCWNAGFGSEELDRKP